MSERRLEIIPIIPAHDAAICEIIKRVGEEYGAVGEGFGPSDAEVESMSQYYLPEQNSLYLVALLNGRIVGGCGISPFSDDGRVCELKKLFLLKEGRGLGLGKQLTQQCLDFAERKGFEQCYLDTLSSMSQAIKLYESLGFKHLSSPLVGTIHGGCDVWMLKHF